MTEEDIRVFLVDFQVPEVVFFLVVVIAGTLAVWPKFGFYLKSFGFPGKIHCVCNKNQGFDFCSQS